jgi:hypothetical protein
MRSPVQSMIISLLVIAIGTAWLLNSMNIIPGVNWVWTIGLAAAGVLIIGLGGFNKLTVVVGPFLIVAAALSLMRQRGTLPVNRELPVLIIALGILMLFSQLSRLPSPGGRRM